MGRGQAARGADRFRRPDPQCRRAADHSAFSQWIGYKLDRRFDHILIDEAQDTNAAQWRIIDALTAEFFSGEGQRGDRMRTLFVVGDYKQAIFRFQGTSPENFRRAREKVREQMLGAVENARELRGNFRPAELLEPELNRSFRTAQPVLDFVDATIAAIGHENIGLDKLPERHSGLPTAGHVCLWRPVGLAGGDTLDGDDGDDGEADWLSEPERELADRIARQVRAWTNERGKGCISPNTAPRPPGRCHGAGAQARRAGGIAGRQAACPRVAVAGVDRLRLGAPLAVKDLVAALRFAAQPFDCLNLAALLVSPLVGWSQAQLLEHGYRGKDVRLWDHLGCSSHPDVAQVLERLGALLRLADLQPRR